MDLSGRGVFLTGGAQGLGRLMIASLLEKGAKVLFCDIERDIGKAAERQLQKQYGADHVTFVQCDVTHAGQLKNAFGKAVKKFGAVDICANNAGIIDETNWEKTISVNMVAQIRGSEMALEHMRKDKGGRGGVIINNVSIGAFIAGYWFPVYIATKHAMLGYIASKAADPDMEAMGVRWCCQCPGPVLTRLVDFHGPTGTRGVKNPDHFLQFSEATMVTPEAVAQAFIEQLEDENNNGKIMLVEPKRGGVYKQRIIVDGDGVSNPMAVDGVFFKKDGSSSSGDTTERTRL